MGGALIFRNDIRISSDLPMSCLDAAKDILERSLAPAFRWLINFFIFVAVSPLSVDILALRSSKRCLDTLGTFVTSLSRDDCSPNGYRTISPSTEACVELMGVCLMAVVIPSRVMCMRCGFCLVLGTDARAVARILGIVKLSTDICSAFRA